MKNPIFVILLFFAINVFPQASFILDKKGKKIEFLKNSIQVVVLDKVVSYKTLSGVSAEISFKDINEAFFGVFKFKNFAFAENRNNYCYFVLAESPKFTLLCLGVPDADDDSSASVRTNYELFVLDNSTFKIVDAMFCSNQKNEKGAKGRSQVFDFLFRNFGKCQDLIDRFSEFEKLNMPQYMGILGFLSQPNFVLCP